MHYAAIIGGNLELVEWLLERGVDVNAKDDEGKTVLYQVIEFDGDLCPDKQKIRHKRKLVRLLVEHGANANIKENWRGHSALHEVVRNNDEDIAKLLIEHGADVKSTDNNGVSILHDAALNGNLKMVRLLVERGADVNAKDDEGLTVLHYAAQSKSLKTIQWLVDQGLDINEKTESGTTVLHYAAQSGSLKTVQWLVKQGLDINAKNNDGNTVLDYAFNGYPFDNNNRKIMKWLKKLGAKRIKTKGLIHGSGCF